MRVLVVDDEEPLRTFLSRWIDKEDGFEVVGAAGDGCEALAFVARLAPDLVLLDITMPGFGGIQAAHRIRRAHPRARLLALSQHYDREAVRGMLRAGVTGYVVKVNFKQELLPALEAVATGGEYFSPDVEEVVADARAEQGWRLGWGGAKQELTMREREVVQLVAEGHTTAEIARLLGVSPRTVENHRRRAMTRLGLRSTAGLIKYAVQRRLTSPDPWGPWLNGRH